MDESEESLYAICIDSVFKAEIMQKEEKMVKINCLLQGDSAEHFLDIKKFKGIANKTEVVRSLISDFWNQNLKGRGS